MHSRVIFRETYALSYGVVGVLRSIGHDPKSDGGIVKVRAVMWQVSEIVFE